MKIDPDSILVPIEMIVSEPAPLYTCRCSQCRAPTDDEEFFCSEECKDAWDVRQAMRPRLTTEIVVHRTAVQPVPMARRFAFSARIGGMAAPKDWGS